MTGAPPSASARGYLTGSLPAVYLEDERRVPVTDLDAPSPEPFVIRWLLGLEEVLDPAVTLLDSLAWHFDPPTSPDDLVRELLCWLGLEAAAELEPDARRNLLRRATPLGRRRGTLAGLRELLARAFPGTGIEVTHSGRATAGDDPADWPPAPPAHVTVSCPGPVTQAMRLALARLVDDACPAHVVWTLEIGERGPGA